MTATDRYLARLIAVPLLSTLVIAAMLLVLDKMLRLFDFVAAEGGPVDVVWRMLANLIPEYMALGIPIGLTLGILLAFRKLALSSELDIFHAVGIGYTRLLRVPYMFAIALALVNFAIVAWVQPLSRYYYEELRFDLRSGALGASIKVGEFNRLGEDMTLRIERSENKGADLYGLFVRVQNGKEQTLSATAARGKFLRTDDPQTILLRLENGSLVHDAPGFASPRILTFASQDLPIRLPTIEQFRLRGDARNEATLPELWQKGRNFSTPKQQRTEAWATFHYRIVEVAMMLLLPLLAVALAVPPKRSTSALGVFLSIVMLVTYHKINEYGEDVAGLGLVDPAIVLWGPFTIFAGLILWMYHVLAHIPGGQPIGALERVANKAGAGLRRFSRLFGRRPAPLASE